MSDESTKLGNLKKSINWIMDHWRQGTALVYTSITICDFIIFPALTSTTNADLIMIAHQARDLDVAVQRDLIMASIKTYEPLTLMGGGMFHVAFGAILTGVAITKETLKSETHGGY